MPIWLYCQSCQQWSKSDASLSKDKTCPLCSNLYISLKPVVDSNPYKVKVNEVEQQQNASPQDETDAGTTAEAVDQERDSAEPAVNESEPPEESAWEESKVEKGSENFDFVDILESSRSPGSAKKAVSEADEKESEPEVSEASGEEAPPTPEEVGEQEKPEPSDPNMIQAPEKVPENGDRPKTNDAVDRAKDGEPDDSAPKKRRLKPR